MLRKTWVSLYDNCKLVFIYEKDLSTSVKMYCCIVQGPEETAAPWTQRFVGVRMTNAPTDCFSLLVCAF